MRDLFHTAHVNAALNHAITYGTAVSLISKSPKYSEAPLGVIAQFINSAIELRQIQIQYDSDQLPTGFIIWGWLSPFTMSTRYKQGAYSLPLAEWNEGEQLCILEAISSKNNIAELIDEFLCKIAKNEKHFFTYPMMHNNKSAIFTKWKHDESKKLIKFLEDQL